MPSEPFRKLLALQGQVKALADLAQLEMSHLSRGRASAPSLRINGRKGNRRGSVGGSGGVDGGGSMLAEQPGTDSDAVAASSTDGSSNGCSSGGSDADEEAGASSGRETGHKNSKVGRGL